MGLFDKFRKKVRDAASEVDTDSLSAEEGSDEAIAALSQKESVIEQEIQTPRTEPVALDDEEEWEDFDDEEDLSLPSNNDDEWDEWEEEEEYTLPTKLTAKKRKFLLKRRRKKPLG